MEYHLTEKSGGCPVCINERKSIRTYFYNL